MALKTIKNTLKMLGSSLPVASALSWRSSGMTSAQRGYGHKWRVARVDYLSAHPFCVYCLREYQVLASTTEGIILECAGKGLALPYASLVDHIAPHRGDQTLFWRRSNWQSLCVSCHSGKKQKEERLAL
jgi:5-methylcytosine-specific restriction protein A